MTVTLSEVELGAILTAFLFSLGLAIVAVWSARSALRELRGRKRRSGLATILGQDPLGLRMRSVDERLSDIGRACRELGLR